MAKTISDLHTELQGALDAHASAQQRASMARSEETDALNRLNAAQKAFDAAIADLKKQAPRESDWKREAMPRFPASAS